MTKHHMELCVPEFQVIINILYENWPISAHRITGRKEKKARTEAKIKQQCFSTMDWIQSFKRKPSYTTDICCDIQHAGKVSSWTAGVTGMALAPMAIVPSSMKKDCWGEVGSTWYTTLPL